jgi:hypothetical protein
MGDTGDEFRMNKAVSQQRRADNRENSTYLLGDAGIEFVSKNEGAHLIVEQRIDFWPGTGLWIVRATQHRDRGVKKLIAYVKNPKNAPSVSFSPNFDERNGIK